MRILGVTASSYELYPAFESIATATGTGSSGTITFSSIPATYQHLQIRLRARGDVAQLIRTVRLRFNSDTGSNYAYHGMDGTGTSATAMGAATQTYMQLGPIAAANAATNVMGVGIIDIHDYASTSKNKTARAFLGANNNDTNTDFSVALYSGLWVSTSAVTSIDVLLNSGNFTTASTFALYGIKGA